MLRFAHTYERMCILLITLLQTWVMGDYFSVDENPQLDLQQDYTLITAPVWDAKNKTTAVFTRNLDTCDIEDVIIAFNADRSLTWAYGYGKWDVAKAAFFNVSSQVCECARRHVQAIHHGRACCGVAVNIQPTKLHEDCIV